MKFKFLIVFLCAVLAACGGGGGSYDASGVDGAAMSAALSSGRCPSVQVYGETVPGRAEALRTLLDAEFGPGRVLVQDTSRPGMRVALTSEPWNSPSGKVWPEDASGELIVMQFGDADAAADGRSTRPDYTPELLRDAFNTVLGGVYGALPDRKPLVLVKPRNAVYAAEVQKVHDYYTAQPITDPRFDREVTVTTADSLSGVVVAKVRARCS